MFDLTTLKIFTHIHRQTHESFGVRSEKKMLPTQCKCYLSLKCKVQWCFLIKNGENQAFGIRQASSCFILAGFANPARKQAKHPSEHDQKNVSATKSYKILQRSETDGRSDPVHRNSPVNTRLSSPLMTSSESQESHPSYSRSLSPSSNSAFTRVSRMKDTRGAGKSKPQVKSPTTSIDLTFSVPTWMDFKFDKVKILEIFKS